MAQKMLFATISTILLLFAGLVYCPQGDTMSEMESESRNYGYRLVQDTSDRETCERDCRERYGMEPYRRGRGGHRDDYYLYARCIQDCETKFWKEYDRRMRELEKENR